MSKKQSPSEKSVKGSEKEAPGPAKSLKLPEKFPYRAQKKFAKLIYQNGGQGQLSKRACLELAERIERIIRDNCEEREDYEHKAFSFVDNILRRPLKIKTAILKNMEKERSEYLEESVINLISV